MILLLAGIMACSKDRLFSPESNNLLVAGPDVNFLPDIPSDLKKASETVMINSAADVPFVTKNKNKIYLQPDDFNRLPDGKQVTYPFHLEVKELLTIKDIILNDKPTVSNGRLLSTDGQILVRAYKNDVALSLNWDNNFFIEMKGMNNDLPDPEMKLFLDEESKDSTTNWQEDTTKNCVFYRQRYVCGKITTRDSVYFAIPSDLGWINIDAFVNYTNTTVVKLKSEANLTNVSTFIFFPELNSVINTWCLEKEFPIPLGVKIKVISFAFSDDDVLYSYLEDFVASPNMEINIKLSKTTKEALLAELEKL